MPDDPRVRELLDELFDRQTTPEEICGADPELLPVVRERWRQINRARVELDELLPAGGSSTKPNPDQTAVQARPVIPGYEIEEVLGQGGMGIVYKAQQRALDRWVAVKMLLAGPFAGSEDLARFRREAAALACLRHPNIVQVYDAGVAEGRPYFAMELIEGESLSQKLAGTPLPAREAAALVATLSAALQVAHQNGIVHRDLKPANIMLTSEGAPKIADFGLARRVEGGAELTQSGVPVGTPSYMAPEQARGQVRNIGPAVDIYALGAILYELLTGRPPFRGESPTETLLQVIHREAVSPARLNAKVPRDLETICLTCLQKDPRHRYDSAAALGDDLQRFLRGEAIAARPDTQLARLVRRVRRQPFLSGAVAIAVLSTIALAGGGLWLLSDRSARARAAHDDVRDMVRYLNDSNWTEARAARDRANGRLGDNPPTDLRHFIERGDRDLELAARLDAIQLKFAEGFIGGVPLVNYETELADALRSADLGTIGENPEEVASRVRESNVRTPILDAIDRYSFLIYTQKPDRSAWALEVAHKADPDQSSWRRRARDLKVLLDRAALKELILARPTTDPASIPYFAFEKYVNEKNHPVPDRMTFLTQLHQAHPGNFWLNLRFGGFLRTQKMNNEALGYLQAATALRPESAIAHWQFGGALYDVGRREESMEQFRRAAQFDPACDAYHQQYVRRLTELGRHDAAVEYLHGVVAALPKSSLLATEFGHSLDRQGQEAEALVWFTKAVELDPTRYGAQWALRNYWSKRGNWNDVQLAWQAALAHRPAKHIEWYGYAELCLFLGKEKEYALARRQLLNQFADTTDANVAERTSRACLIYPATGNDLLQAATLAERPLADAQNKSGDYHPYYLFARGMAEFRQGNFDKAIATMNGEASRVLGPSPRLVLAMALHKKGQAPEARQTLAAAVTVYDWRPARCVNQDAWIAHVLRREAENLILPNLQAFLTENYEPRDNDERIALVGICQFTDRTVAQARLYADAFAADPSLLELSQGHRYAAARAAALAGCGRGSDAAGLDETERSRWRGLALLWLRQDLSTLTKVLNNKNDPKALQRLRQWETEDDFAGLRQSSSLLKLPSVERKGFVDLWTEVRAVLSRHGKTP